MAQSAHRVEVVRLGPIEKHPNADSLGLARIYGYTCCVQLGDFQEGDLVAYVPPDSVVSDRPEFEFLGDHKRIRVKKLRGILSQGLLIKAPEGSKEGDDVAESLGITHYEPPVPVAMGVEAESPPPGFHHVYDVETFYRYPNLFQTGEQIIITEKLHGTSARYVWTNGRLYCGSRKEWKREDKSNLYWHVTSESPWLADFCQQNPDITVYGEIYGWVQDLHYGAKRGQAWFRVFDLLEHGQWASTRSRVWSDLLEHQAWSDRAVPLVYEGLFDKDKTLALANGPSLIPDANHLREGIVVKPVVERTCPEIGRVQLKIVSNEYLERA